MGREVVTYQYDICDIAVAANEEARIILTHFLAHSCHEPSNNRLQTVMLNLQRSYSSTFRGGCTASDPKKHSKVMKSLNKKMKLR